MNKQQPSDGEGGESGDMASEDASPGTDSTRAVKGLDGPMMEQMLDRAEGDSRILLRNQFKNEERWERERRGGWLVEPRPW
jgi:hypothetical protein